MQLTDLLSNVRLNLRSGSVAIEMCVAISTVAIFKVVITHVVIYMLQLFFRVAIAYVVLAFSLKTPRYSQQ